MAYYRKISCLIGNDEKFRDLSDKAKLLWFTLLSHQHLTRIGAMRATAAGLASEMGWPEKAFREAFAEALSKGMVEYDEKASCLILPNFLKHNPPESPNVVRSWQDAADMIPECCIRDQHLLRVKAFTEALPEAFGKALPEAFRKAMPNRKLEPEHKEKEIPPPTPSRGDGHQNGNGRKPKEQPQESEKYEPTWESQPWPTIRRFVWLYNAHCPESWPYVKIVGDGLRKKIREYLHQFPEEAFWLTTFTNAQDSKFCLEYHNGSLAWLLQRGAKDAIENCTKVFERKFDR